MNYRVFLEGHHRLACEFCLVWNPIGKQVGSGRASLDLRQFLCSNAPTLLPEQREFINKPCLVDDWTVCSLNPANKR